MIGKGLLLFCLLGLSAGDVAYSRDAAFAPTDIATNNIGGSYPPATNNIGGNYPPATNNIASYSPAAPVYTKWEEEPDQSFNVQSGYEGYLVPSEPPFSFSDFLRTAGILTILPPLSKIGFKLALKFGVWILGFLSLFLVGSLITTTVCTFTPLCTISFLGLGFNRESVRSLLTHDRLESATEFLAGAIKKFSHLNKKDVKEKEKSN